MKWRKLLSLATSMVCMTAWFGTVGEPIGEISAADVCVIDSGTTYQTIRGFGGMNHPEWAGDLTAAQRQTAFGNGEGELGFSIVRVYVNEDRNQGYRALETAKTAQAMGALVFASPWNPPDELCEPDGESQRLRHDISHRIAT